MHLSHLKLEEFRRFSRLELQLPETGIGIYGANAAGKTTILESIAMTATTKSPRALSDREVIAFDSGTALGVAPYSRIEAHFSRLDGFHTIAIGIETPLATATAFRKVVTLDGQNRRATDAVGAFKCVLFEPTDVDLVTGSPSLRRRYLDQMICQIDRLYMRALSRYVRIVEQRNSLLKGLLRQGLTRLTPDVVQQLSYWNEELMLHGSSIIGRRFRFLERLQVYASQRFRSFSPGHEIELTMLSSVGALQALTGRVDAPITEIDGVIRRDFEQQLERTAGDELRRGMTLTGPHRDDLLLRLDGKDLATYGSRGQQRLVVAAMKLAEADLIREEIGESPVLLLDDILSELDLEHRQTLLVAVGGLQTQVLLTATDRADLTSATDQITTFAELRDGQLRMEPC